MEWAGTAVNVSTTSLVPHNYLLWVCTMGVYFAATRQKSRSDRARTQRRASRAVRDVISHTEQIVRMRFIKYFAAFLQQ